MTTSPVDPPRLDAPADRPETTLGRVEDLQRAVAARDTFIAVAAHELRNPMMPISGQLDLLITAVRADRCSLEQVQERLSRIQQANRRYMRRAVVLLDVARNQVWRLQAENRVLLRYVELNARLHCLERQART